MEDLKEVTAKIYREAAMEPKEGLCCTTSPVWRFPDLHIPEKMLSMNYGCGSTVSPRDLINNPSVLYVGVGGGLELLQFAYFSRRIGSVIGIDVVDEMIEAAYKNLIEAERMNDWFNKNFVELRKGNALDLPVGDRTVDIAAQNCLFNIFHTDDLTKALSEMYRVLKPGGRLVLSDPVTDKKIPKKLRNDSRLRSLCLTGAIPLKDYISLITGVGFGTLEIRAKRPYRVLSKHDYPKLDKHVFIESVELCAIKDPMPEDGPCIFSGRTVFYTGKDAFFDDGKGHVLMKDQPVSVCDKTAFSLSELDRDDLFVSEPTFHYDGGGCC